MPTTARKPRVLAFLQPTTAKSSCHPALRTLPPTHTHTHCLTLPHHLIPRLRAQAAAVGQWARLARSQRYRTAVKQLRDGLQHDLLEAQSLCARQAAQLEQLQQLAAGSQAECEELVRRLEEAEALHSREVEVGVAGGLQALDHSWAQRCKSSQLGCLHQHCIAPVCLPLHGSSENLLLPVHCTLVQHLAECHAHEAAALQQEWAAARLELQRQADLMAKAAGAAVEQRAKAELAARWVWVSFLV